METEKYLPAAPMSARELCANMESVNALGQTLAQSGFFGAVSASTATAALVNCFLEGLTPQQYKAKYHTFDNGQTGVKSDYIQREFHRLGGDWTFNEWTAEKCDMVFTYKGKTLPFCVTLDEFKQNGVALAGPNRLKTNWAKFPREMLKARCMATAIRAICPEALGGMYTQEEVSDFERADVQPQKPVVVIQQSPLASEVNPLVCPCGNVKGKAWDTLPTDTLLKVLESDAKAITDEHREAIRTELAVREEVAAREEA